MKTCPYCKKEDLSNEAKRCPYCRTWFGMRAHIPNIAAVAVILIAIIIFGGVAGCTYFFYYMR